jgi:metal-responsive CopG/Arc/MetJ family transcriptional regulator
MARGGKRTGAGRPKGNPDELYRRVSLTLSPDILTLVDEYALEHKMSRSAAVEKLLGLGLKAGKKR